MIRELLPILALVTHLGASVVVSAAEKPNVLFIMADDLRNDLGCYGSPAKTPHLDALAQRGVRLDHAFCQQALCNPSRSSLLTGRRPDTLQLWSNSQHFRTNNPDVVTLPQHFKNNGYQSRCVGKIFHNWHTTEKGDRRSWSADEFLHYANHGDDIAQVKGELPPNRALPMDRMYGRVPLCEQRDVPDDAYYDGRVAAEAVRVLAEVKDRPFFLAVGFWKPHAPFNAPKKYWDLYQPTDIPELRASARPDGAPAIAFHDSREILGAPPKQFQPNAAQIATLRHGYFANISYLDAQVGRVLKALNDHQLTDKTIVVFLSDHGFHLGEFGLWGKTSCFEQDARVPLIIAAPGMQTAGKAIADVVELLDLFPTLTDLCGLKAPPGLEGHSLVPVLNGQKGTKTVAFTQHPRPAYYDRTEKDRPEAMGYSVRTAHGRYTEWREWKTGKLLGVEYYERVTELENARNLFADKKDSPQLQAARAALHQQFPPDVPPAQR
ncbi:MAG: sulfatase [Gemmataceae bacterium]|nr:sulfatase [Gemmata sp.]MDW8198172.1 sulfatase [Gemmataceae bacterium]